jgi:hypothetical protein
MVEQIFDHIAPDDGSSHPIHRADPARARLAALMFAASTGPLDSAPMIGLLCSL